MLNEEHPGWLRQQINGLTSFAGGWLQWAWLPAGLGVAAFRWLYWFLSWAPVFVLVACGLFVLWMTRR